MAALDSIRMTNANLHKEIKELRAMLKEQREICVMVLVEGAFMYAAIQALAVKHPESQAVFELFKIHFKDRRDHLAAIMRDRKLKVSLESFLDGTADNPSADLSQNN
jgi:hypothetical protein